MSQLDNFYCLCILLKNTSDTDSILVEVMSFISVNRFQTQRIRNVNTIIGLTLPKVKQHWRTTIDYLRDAITEQEVFEMSGHRVAKKTTNVVPTPTLLKSPHFNHICIYWQWLLNKWFEHTGTDRLRTIVCFRGTELSINLAQVMLDLWKCSFTKLKFAAVRSNSFNLCT